MAFNWAKHPNFDYFSFMRLCGFVSKFLRQKLYRPTGDSNLQLLNHAKCSNHFSKRDKPFPILCFGTLTLAVKMVLFMKLTSTVHRQEHSFSTWMNCERMLLSNCRILKQKIPLSVRHPISWPMRDVLFSHIFSHFWNTSSGSIHIFVKKS